MTSVVAMHMVWSQVERWVYITPFGLPVVPLV